VQSANNEGKESPKRKNSDVLESNPMSNKFVSKNFKKISKPMALYSFAIFFSIFVLSGFYFLTLWAMGFFSGEAQSMLTLKKKIFQEQISFYSINFDLLNTVFDDVMNFEEPEKHKILERLGRHSSYLRNLSYEIDKEVLGLKNEDLKKTLHQVMEGKICSDVFKKSQYFGYYCKEIRSSILETGNPHIIQ
jgi:hypothetical protein